MTTTVPSFAADLRTMTLGDIAEVIAEDWTRPYFGAVPYLDAMHQLADIDDRFYMDSGEDVVRYFLSNASTWRGGTARAVKAELKRRLAA